jgi:hypothetical protein
VVLQVGDWASCYQLHTIKIFLLQNPLPQKMRLSRFFKDCRATEEEEEEEYVRRRQNILHHKRKRCTDKIKA